MRSIALVSLFLLLVIPSAFEGAPLEKQKRSRPIMAIVAYRPRPGKEALLLELTKEHVPVLRAQGLATERASYVMRATDGTIIEVFEWKSQAAIDGAHANVMVSKMWERYSEACEYVPLKNLREAGDTFAGSEPIDP